MVKQEPSNAAKQEPSNAAKRNRRRRQRKRAKNTPPGPSPPAAPPQGEGEDPQRARARLRAAAAAAVAAARHTGASRARCDHSYIPTEASALSPTTMSVQEWDALCRKRIDVAEVRSRARCALTAGLCPSLFALCLSPTPPAQKRLFNARRRTMFLCIAGDFHMIRSPQLKRRRAAHIDMLSERLPLLHTLHSRG